MQRPTNLSNFDSSQIAKPQNYYTEIHQSYANNRIDYSVPQALMQNPKADNPGRLLDQIMPQSPVKTPSYQQRINTAFNPSRSSNKNATNASVNSPIVAGHSTLKNPRDSCPTYDVSKKVLSPRPQPVYIPGRKYTTVQAPLSPNQ